MFKSFILFIINLGDDIVKPVILCILDGVGYREEEYGNAFKKANTEFLDFLWNKYPHCFLEASGESVGLPKNTMGNSEVGHMNIGAGKVVYQPSQFINQEIDNGTFYKNSNLIRAIDKAKNDNVALHIIGLISDAGVHSLFKHLFAILDMAKERGITKVYIHGFSDGRDTPPTSGIDFFKKLQDKLNKIEIGSIATLMGRYYGMDRDNRWDRVKKAYDAIVCGLGKEFDSVEDAILNSYENGITDEFIEPIILDKDGLIKENDVVIDFNFRPDRLRELLSALSNPKFNGFDREYININLTTLMPVSNEVICTNAYSNQKIDFPLGVCLNNEGKKQLRIAETEKYVHVTYFFDGGVERKLDGCERILIPSPKVTTYDLSPKMSSLEITNTLLEEIDKNIYDVIILNYANGDMLGHTGNINATVESLEFLDKCVERLFNKVEEKSGLLIITADHGNCEYMLDEKGNPVTSHTTNKVPFIICNNDFDLKNGKLSDIAPTVLKIMNLNIPKEMTGDVLIK